MIIDETFFGIEGLTSTSANHVANLAKEYIEGLRSRLNHISFVTSNVSIIGSSEKNVIKKEIEWKSLYDMKDLIEKVAKATSLIAWLREAISEKDKILIAIENLDLEKYSVLTGDVIPVRKEQKCKCLTEEEWTSNQNIKKRNKIISLTAEAAVFGQYIHKDGPINKARNEYLKRLSEATEVKENGRDTLCYTYTSKLSEETINQEFFRLQTHYRSLQAELNKYRNEMLMAIKESELAYNEEKSKLDTEYYSEASAFNNRLAEYKKKQAVRLSKMKIVIPNDLKGIYETINGLSDDHDNKVF